MTDSQLIIDEIERRISLWSRAHDYPAVTPGVIRQLGLYAGQAGIYRQAAKSKSVFGGDGLALSFLHTGATYDDDLSDNGMLYHYPSTNRIGRHDEAEIASAKAAYSLGVRCS